MHYILLNLHVGIMEIDSGGKEAVAPWILMHSTDIVDRGLIVLFFGFFFRRPPPLPEIFFYDALG